MTDDDLTPTPRPLPRRRSSGIPRMAKPAVRPTELSDAPVVEPMPRSAADVPEAPTQVETFDEPVVAVDSDPAVEVETVPEPEADGGREADAGAVAEPVTEPTKTAEAAEEREATTRPESVARGPDPDLPTTVRETLRRVDDAWRAFHAAAARFPAERMDERLTEHGWTVKQMLAHIAAWHDLTADRMIKFINTGQPAEFDQDADAFNAMVARRAVGRTAGEILNDTDATFHRLRRQMQRLTDAQLNAHDVWAAWVIRANTYEHYDEHRADIHTPEALPGGRRR